MRKPVLFSELSAETLTRLGDGLRFLESELCRRGGWRRRGTHGRTLHDAILMTSRAYAVSGGWLVCLLYAALFAPTNNVPTRVSWEKVEQWEKSKNRRPQHLRKLLRRAGNLVRPAPTPS